MDELHLIIGDSEIKVNKTNFTIGSDKSCDYVNPKLAPKHLSFSYIEGKWIGNSLLEIKLNGNPIIGKFDLKDNDIIEIGDFKIIISLKKFENPYFRIIVGSHVGSMIKIEKSGIIGRETNADYIIEDEYVSRRHAKIEILDGKIIWEDLQAKNPTIINGKIYKKKELKSGDEIVIGKTRLLFVNPKEKPEYEIYKKPSKRAIFIILTIMLILLSILTTYIWTSNRINAFYYHYNNAKEAINKSFEAKRIDEKISLLKYAIYETENAKKIKNSPDLEIIENLAKNKLNAWEEVLKIKNQINKLNLASFQEKLRNLESILSDDKLFQEIYAQILKARLLSEYISTAKTLKEQGKVEEAKKLIEIVQSKIETTTINLETKIEEQPQLKVPKTKEPTISSDIKIDIPEIGKVDITIQRQEKALEGVSLNYALKLKELYEDKGDLEGTIKLAMDILKEDPKNTSAEFYLQIAKKEVQAIQLEKEGRYKEALNLWSEILKLDQNNIRAKKAIIRLGSKI